MLEISYCNFGVAASCSGFGDGMNQCVTEIPTHCKSGKEGTFLGYNFLQLLCFFIISTKYPGLPHNDNSQKRFCM